MLPLNFAANLAGFLGFLPNQVAHPPPLINEHALFADEAVCVVLDFRQKHFPNTNTHSLPYIPVPYDYTFSVYIRVLIHFHSIHYTSTASYYQPSFIQPQLF
jgi:hypothetical protein